MIKDLSTKALTKCADVFSDICNVNLFDSEEMIQPGELLSEETSIVYRNPAGLLQEHRMDVRMRHTVSNVDIALFCLENQAQISNIMPVRDMGYLYSGYSEQIRKIKEINEQVGMRYYTKEIGDRQKLIPVISLILYYGLSEWTGPESILDMLEIAEDWRAVLEPLIADHKIKVVYLAGQSEGTREKYKSDFRHIVDYLAYARQKDKKRLEQFSKDSSRKIVHPWEYLDMMYAFTKDEKYLMILEQLKNTSEEEEETDVCILMDLVEERGVEKGMEKGMEKINLLNLRLLEDGRGDEMVQAAKDLVFQKELMVEYGI